MKESFCCIYILKLMCLQDCSDEHSFFKNLKTTGGLETAKMEEYCSNHLQNSHRKVMTIMLHALKVA